VKQAILMSLVLLSVLNGVCCERGDAKAKVKKSTRQHARKGLESPAARVVEPDAEKGARK